MMGFLAVVFGTAAADPAPEGGLWGVVVAYVLPPLLTAIASLAAWALLRLSKWLQSKTENEWVRATEERTFNAVAVAVRDVEQRVRKTVALTAADGRVTPAEAARLRDEALAAARAQLGARGWEGLLGLHGGDEAAATGYLGRAIEAEVHDLPKGGRALVGATAPQNPVGTA